MNRKELSGSIFRILEEKSRLTNNLYSLNLTEIQKYPENYHEMAFAAALRGEWIACSLRRLLYFLPRVSKPLYLSEAAKTIGINVTYENDIVNIFIPCMLPNRKQS